MNKWLLLLCGVFVNINAFGENITGEWHRNTLFATAELTINQDMSFAIDATRASYLGSIDGTLTKIKDGYYFSYITDGYEVGQSCVMIFIDRIEKIEIMVYGDQVGAGYSVYYDGIYEKSRLPEHEFINRALDHVIGNYFDKDMVKELLGDDLEYFVHCFGNIIVKRLDNGIIIDGWMPGIAPWYNGIIKIENDHIYLLITDCRGETVVLNYYTNDGSQTDIPGEFRNWHYFNDETAIVKKTINTD